MLRAPPRSHPVRSPRSGAVLGDGRPGTMNLNYPAFADPQRALNVTLERSQIRSPRLTEAQRHGEVLPPLRRSPRGGGYSPRSLKPGAIPSLLAPKPSLEERWGSALDKKYGARTSALRIFERIDKDRTGTLNAEEALKSIVALQIQVDKGEIDQMLRDADTNGDGVIDFREFEEAVEKLGKRSGTVEYFGMSNRPKQAAVLKMELGQDTGGLATDHEIDQYMSSLRSMIETKYGLLRKAFLSMDKDRSMSLTKEEIVEGLQNFCIPVPRNHIGQLFDRIDVDRNGKVSYLEFCEKLKAYELGEQA